MIYLDAKVFAGASFIYKEIKINGDNISWKIALSQSDMILISLEFAIIKFCISCLNIIMSFVQPF